MLLLYIVEMKVSNSGPVYYTTLRRQVLAVNTTPEIYENATITSHWEKRGQGNRMIIVMSLFFKCSVQVFLSILKSKFLRFEVLFRKVLFLHFLDRLVWMVDLTVLK